MEWCFGLKIDADPVIAAYGHPQNLSSNEPPSIYYRAIVGGCRIGQSHMKGSFIPTRSYCEETPLKFALSGEEGLHVGWDRRFDSHGFLAFIERNGDGARMELKAHGTAPTIDGIAQNGTAEGRAMDAQLMGAAGQG